MFIENFKPMASHYPGSFRNSSKYKVHQSTSSLPTDADKVKGPLLHASKDLIEYKETIMHTE